VRNDKLSIDAAAVVRVAMLTQAWREDNWRVSNGEQVKRLAAHAMMRKLSVDFSGYWQKTQVNRLVPMRARVKDSTVA
jgi:hypothetical protein